MVRLKHLSFHSTNDVPDHILHEMQDLAVKLITAIMPIVKEHEPNVVLSSLDWMHASLLKHLISETPGELEKAGNMAAKCLINNIKILINSKEKNDQ